MFLYYNNPVNTECVGSKTKIAIKWILFMIFWLLVKNSSVVGFRKKINYNVIQSSVKEI